MRVNYPELIKENPEELHTLERKHRQSHIGRRLQLLRLLKSEECRSVREAADILGYSLRQCLRWLKQYRQEGLVGVMHNGIAQGGNRYERMTPEAWQALGEAMKRGEIGSYKQARELLGEHGVKYQDDTSILRLFRRHEIKAKTGRYRHEKADPKEQETFKKNLC